MSGRHSKTVRRWSEHPGLVIAVFVISLVVMVVRQQLSDPTWVPHGADWDTWYQSVAAIGHPGIKYPANRWPIYALFAAFFGLLPGPLHVNVQVASLTATAGSVAGVFLICRTLFGLPGAITVAVLTVTLPIVAMLSSWMSAYPLWATAAVWAVAGLVEALRTGRRGWWVVSGAGVATVLAVMAKGLGIGLALLALVGACTLLTGRKCLGNLGRVAIPLVLMSLLYLLFPSPLLTLDAQASMQSTELGPPANARVPTARGRGERGPPGSQGPFTDPAAIPVMDAAVTPEQQRALFEDGYIFGRSMNPVRIYNTLTLVKKSPEEQESRLRAAISRLDRMFPTFDQSLRHWMLAGGAAGLLWSVVFFFWKGRRGWRRAAAPLAGWLGLLGIIAGVLPSLLSLFTPRFLLPAFVVAPIFFVAPVALLTRWTPFLSWSSLLLIPIALVQATPWPDSPWLQGGAVYDELRVVEIPIPEAVSLWYTLAQEYPDADIYVMTAPDQGLLTLQDRDGTLFGGDPRFTVIADEPPKPSQYILTSEAADEQTKRAIARDGGYQASSECQHCAQRPVVRELRFDTVLMKLYGPAS